MFPLGYSVMKITGLDLEKRDQEESTEQHQFSFLLDISIQV